ncbi:ESX secretion-associated protein EspG [Actinokineospora bangkokensis]|uniref:ESX secretion-associated protein EspG n=1 Tax=Actinokineospora bangkokensis TaxID=1193682 RepID=A0A1Q9LII4_9PSEU|nr:ESX secretion-associated protein EspG [Actinokineospora bangkokensis]OLR91820.1 hypothetical protein BJP25_23555 [Actinokineospora bangkokensis]
MIATTHRLDEAELDITWSALGLGRLPHPLGAPSAGATMAERARVAERVRDSLTARGLWSARGVDPELAVLLGVLAESDLAVDVVGYLDRPCPATGASGLLRARGAVARGQGVVGVMHPDGALSVLGTRPGAVLDEVVALLPEAPAGPGQALSVPVGQSGREPDWADGFERAHGKRTDADRLAELVDERVSGGQFGVTAARTRLAPVITWFDTPRGRYLAISDNGWLSAAPADPARIARRLAAVVD